jgi:hypothetical protein
MRREFTYLRRFITIEEPDEWDSPHHMLGAGHPGHGEPEIKLKIDGQELMVHRLANGQFHTHELPFVLFTNVDELAKAYVSYLEYGIDYGRPEEPK